MQKVPLASASRIVKQGRLAPFFLNHPCGQGLGLGQGTCHHALIILPLAGDGGPKAPDQPANQNIAWPMDPDVKPGQSHEDSKKDAKGHKPHSVPFHKGSGPKQRQHGVKRHSHGGVPTRKRGGMGEVRSGNHLDKRRCGPFPIHKSFGPLGRNHSQDQARHPKERCFSLTPSEESKKSKNACHHQDLLVPQMGKQVCSWMEVFHPKLVNCLKNG